MIVTVTPNPSMDEAYLVPEFNPGRWFRASSVERSPGGRGINVSHVLSQLGWESVATGFLAGHTGDFIQESLYRAGITTNFVNVAGENRTNTYVIDEIGGLETAITDVGPDVSPDAVDRFFWNLDKLLPRAECVLMGGSLPPGVPVDFFRDVTNRARQYNIPVFIDTFGPPLAEVLEALPTVVKIDHRFMDSVKGITLSALEHLIDLSKKIYDQGVDWIITSYFNNGNLFCTPQGYFLAEIERADMVSVLGANDALMAGMIVARLERMGVEESIRFAMACVQEDVRHIQKGVPSRAAVEAALRSVTIQKVR